MKTRTLCVLSVIITGVCFAPESLASEVKLVAASFQPQNVVFAKYFYRFVSETNSQCAGKVSINVKSKDEIASNRQWHALKYGAIDIYYGPANFYRGILSEADVLNIAHNSPAEQRANGAWKILNSLHNKHMNAWYLTTLLSGVKFYIYTTKPAKGGRFDGLRIRSVPLYRIALEAFGAETRQMAANDIKVALENGKIEGFGWPLWGLGIYGWDKLVKFRYGTGFMNAAAPVLVNLEKWRSLSNDQRDCLTKMAIWVEKEWPRWRELETKKALLAQNSSGIRYKDLGDEFARKTEAIYWRMLTTASPEFSKQIRPLLRPSK